MRIPTLPRCPIKDEVVACEVVVLVGSVSELSNAAIPEQDAVVPVLVTPFKEAEPSDASISKEEDIATLVAVARMATRLSMKPSLLLSEIG